VYLSLFTSVGTLICCALPSLLVLLGFGASVASLLSAAPWLVGLSRHKVWVFAIAAGMLALSGAYVYRLAPRWAATAEPCPPDRRDACAAAGRASRILLWAAVALYAAGFFVAYVLGPILGTLGA
jgi:hypothetical protein